MSATVVLVHGAWHGAWCWERVTALLDSAGVPSVAVDLPGHGSDDGPITDLHGDAARVSDVLDGVEGDVVLVGHSYGGAVVTEAGVHPAVRHLVYLCAFNLDGAESCMNAAGDEEGVADISHVGRPSLADALEIHDDGTVTLPSEGAAACFYNDCDEETTAWAVSRLGPHSLEALGQSPAAVAWQSRPSTYAVCELDLGVHPDLQRILARRCTEVVEWPVSHSPFLSRPDLVADLLVRLAD